MSIPELSPQAWSALSQVVEVLSGAAACEAYGRDQTEDLFFMPLAVVLPRSTEEVAAVCRWCYAWSVPITVRAGGTGLAGGALPTHGGLIMSLERMNKILHLDEESLQVRVEAGLITQVLQDYLAERGWYYPPDPASRGSCCIGGNVATNAGGPRAVKYGVVKDYVLNLEVVLPQGEVIWTGANTLKNATGYNLTQLMVGSDGTLGIVTQVVLKLWPLPSQRLLMLADFVSPQSACAAVSAIFRVGVIPSALEFMERSALEAAAAYLGRPRPKQGVEAQLLIELDGWHLEALYADAGLIGKVLEEFGSGEVAFADSAVQQAELWALRRCVGHAVKTRSIYREVDTVVPRAKLPDLLSVVKALGQIYGFESVCYGHAGDGNLHVNILRGDLSLEAWQHRVPLGIAALFKEVKALGGTLSGEHGVGYVQRPYLDLVFEPWHRDLMRGIKAEFDPAHLLNPDKAI